MFYDTQVEFGHYCDTCPSELKLRTQIDYITSTNPFTGKETAIPTYNCDVTEQEFDELLKMYPPSEKPWLEVEGVRTLTLMAYDQLPRELGEDEVAMISFWHWAGRGK